MEGLQVVMELFLKFIDADFDRECKGFQYNVLHIDVFIRIVPKAMMNDVKVRKLNFLSSSHICFHLKKANYLLPSAVADIDALPQL